MFYVIEHYGQWDETVAAELPTLAEAQMYRDRYYSEEDIRDLPVHIHDANSSAKSIGE